MEVVKHPGPDKRTGVLHECQARRPGPQEALVLERKPAGPGVEPRLPVLLGTTVALPHLELRGVIDGIVHTVAGVPDVDRV
jgi:hypothetical protein